MVDSIPPPTISIERGVTALRAWLGAGAALLVSVAPRRGESASFEYALPADFTGVERTVRISFLSDFPKSPLQVRVEPSPWLRWPHALPDGICLFGTRQSPAGGTPEEVVEESMRRLGQLVALVVPEADVATRQAEFESEILSYWTRQLSLTSAQILLVERPGTACPLFALSDSRSRFGAVSSRLLLAPAAFALSRHWRRMTGEKQTVRDPAAAAFYLPLASIPSVEIPAAADVPAWLSGHASDLELNATKAWLHDSAGMSLRYLVLRLPGAVAAQHVALGVRGATIKPDRHITYGRRAARSAVHNSPIGAAKYRGLEYAKVHVLDREQVHSRDTAYDTAKLERSKVIVVGVGSLGSSVATLLARGGIGNLWLVDNEFLEDANLGRHALGIDDLGQLKSKALSERLRRDTPTVEVSPINERLQSAQLSHRDVFAAADLVVCTSADWPCESALWDAKAGGAPWILVQGWSEPHAQIGHALVAPTGPYDGRSLFDKFGRFLHRVTDWPDDGIHALPGCGAGFIPGGPAAMASIAAMVAGLILDVLANPISRPIWSTSIGGLDAIARAGGSYKGPQLPAGATRITLTRDWPGPAAENT